MCHWEGPRKPGWTETERDTFMLMMYINLWGGITNTINKNIEAITDTSKEVSLEAYTKITK
jgi:hypothetical protein